MNQSSLPHKPTLRSLLSVLFFLTSYFLLLTSPAQAGITNPVAPAFSSGDYGNVLAKMVALIWKAAVVLGGLFFIFYFVWGAFRWMTAEGDKSKFESGREKITDAVIGLILLVASYAIIYLLGQLLDIEFLRNFQFTIPEPQ